MGYGAGLLLHLLAARRAARRAGPAEAPAGIGAGGRPADAPGGPVVWLHAASPDDARGLPELIRRMAAARPGLAAVVTCPGPVCGFDAATPILPPPAGTLDAARAFLDRCLPDLCIMAGSALRPALIHEAAQRGVPLLLVGAGAPVIVGSRFGWWPGFTAGLLGRFDRIFPLDAAAGQALRQAGAPRDRIAPGGWLDEGSHALPCTEAERAALASTIGTRPVWLAAALPGAEDDTVAIAHIEALRMAHRLLLIVVPDDPARGAELAERLAARHGLSVMRRATEDEPEEETQVYVADTEDEYGLWYRLAPVTYLGGSISGAGCLRHPFEAAALGSALLHGPDPAPHAAACTRLRLAGGSRVVRGATDLWTAIGDLLAPDLAARQAQVAWDVCTAGAGVTAGITGLALELLARRRA